MGTTAVNWDGFTKVVARLRLPAEITEPSLKFRPLIVKLNGSPKRGATVWDKPADDAVTFLQQALQQSIEADRHYRDAFFEAAQSGGGCPPPQNASFRLAARSNAGATSAKRRFVAAFNPLASRFGRRTWTPADF